MWVSGPGVKGKQGMESTRTIADMLADLRAVKDRKDELNAALKEANQQESEFEGEILAALEISGVDKASLNGAGTASRVTKWRAVYEPDKWQDLVKWCAENNRTDIVQRRLADSRLLEMMDAGKELPVGVTMKPYSELSFRRD